MFQDSFLRRCEGVAFKEFPVVDIGVGFLQVVSLQAIAAP
jgi:hypothetical protein